MNHRQTIRCICILFIGLFAFTITVNAAAGDLDLSFSLDGKTAEGVGSSRTDLAYAIAIQPDGKIVVVGSADYGSSAVCGIARYNTDGSLDASFDEDGRAFASANYVFYCRAVAIQPDGKIIAAGYSLSGYDFALVRLNPDGSLDQTFDGDGKVTTTIIATSTEAINAVTIQPDGKIVAAGYSNSGFALIRYSTLR